MVQACMYYPHMSWTVKVNLPLCGGVGVKPQAFLFPDLVGADWTVS